MFCVFVVASPLVLLVLLEFEGLADRVNDPSEDLFSGAPAAVSLQQLLEGDGFGAARFI